MGQDPSSQVFNLRYVPEYEGVGSADWPLDGTPLMSHLGKRKGKKKEHSQTKKKKAKQSKAKQSKEKQSKEKQSKEKQSKEKQSSQSQEDETQPGHKENEG